MGLAPAVGEFELANGLGIPAVETKRHIARELPQREGREGQGEEAARILVDRPRTLLHHDIVKVGGEIGERELARAHILAQLHDLVPGFPGEPLRHLDLSFGEFRGESRNIGQEEKIKTLNPGRDHRDHPFCDLEYSTRDEVYITSTTHTEQAGMTA